MNNWELWFGNFILVLVSGFIGHWYAQYQTSKRLKKQKILQSIDITNFFSPEQFIDCQLAVKESDEIYKLNNLFLVKFSLENIGNTAFDKFEFQLDVDEGYEITRLISEKNLRSQGIQIQPHTPSFNRPLNETDIILIPFNRKEKYEFALQIHSDDKAFLSSEDIHLSTKSDVEFIMNTVPFRKKPLVSIEGNKLWTYTTIFFLILGITSFSSLVITLLTRLVKTWFLQ